METGASASPHPVLARAQTMKVQNMIHITFPDGNSRQYAAGVTGAAIAESLSKSLAKKAVSIFVNEAEWDLTRPIMRDARVRLVVRDDPEGLELIRHDTAHILAQAVQELFPGTQITIGPNIEDGFFYDVAPVTPLSLEDLPKIEARMREIVDSDTALVREEWPRDAAIAHFKSIGEHYKAEIIADLPADEPISIYRTGDWLDLCRGPHMPSTGKVGKAFKLLKLAGAYWRGDHTKAMLQRIYGTAWRTEEELAAYVHRVEEAEKRDHRRIGRAMDLFHIQEEGKGMIFWHPKGWTLYRTMLAYMRRRIEAAGYVEVKTPQILEQSFWEKSGHWEKFHDSMFVCETDEGEVMAVKPMNCPCHVQIFNHGQRSYRDLPIRMAEFEGLHRCESSGSTHGLLRVRQMSQDDAHIFCTDAQIVEESKAFIELLNSVYADFGVELHSVKLALRPDKRFGTDAQWTIAEDQLEEAAHLAGIEVERIANEGAFYGPKLEFHLRDAIGRTWQCGTLQLDYVLPERLDASYIAEDGQKHRPVMLHRAICGSMERFIGVLIEHFAGAFPLWLAPVQIVVATITSDADAYAMEVVSQLRAVGLRAEIDVRNEKINYKIREHSLAKVPIIAVVGRKEAEQRTIALRRLGGDAQSLMPLETAPLALSQEAFPPDLARARRSAG